MKLVFPCKSAIWPATAVDANFSVISSGVVNQINNFLGEISMEVGVDTRHYTKRQKSWPVRSVVPAKAGTQ